MRKITLLALLCLTFFAQAGERNLATAKLDGLLVVLARCGAFYIFTKA